MKTHLKPFAPRLIAKQIMATESRELRNHMLLQVPDPDDTGRLPAHVKYLTEYLWERRRMNRSAS